MAKKPAKAQAKAKKPAASKPKAKAAPSKVAATKAKPDKKTVSKAPAKAVVKSKTLEPKSKSAPATKVLAPKAAKALDKPKKASTPSVMGSKLKKDADEPEDDFLDDDIEIDPELAEFVEDVAELEEADAAAEKAIAGGSDDEDQEVAAPLKKTPKEKSATERRIKKERDLLSGIDRNGDLSEIWQKFYDTHKNEKPKQYSMRDSFEAKSALQHVKLGWGFILSNINDRLEVLFKEGIKILISNYKS
jgi:hypothetical protein